MIVSLLLVLLIVFISGASQVLLKIGSAHQGKWKNSVLAVYLNLPTLSAYGLLLFVTVISVLALNQGIPLKMFYAITSLNLVVVVGLSWGILKEEVNKTMIVGIVLIVTGIILFNIQ